MLEFVFQRFIVQHEPCEFKCKCRLNKSVCKSKQKWNRDECRCECKELDDLGSCEKDYMWNHNICDCEYNKACKIDGYSDTNNCSCEKILIVKLVLGREDEILSTAEASPDDKKVTRYDETRYLVLFESEKYDLQQDYSRITYLIEVKSGITYVISHNYTKIKTDSYDSLALEKTMTIHLIILIKSVLNKDQRHYCYNIF